MGRFFLASRATCASHLRDPAPFFSLTLSYAWAMLKIGARQSCFSGAPVWFWGPQGRSSVRDGRFGAEGSAPHRGEKNWSGVVNGHCRGDW